MPVLEFNQSTSLLIGFVASAGDQCTASCKARPQFPPGRIGIGLCAAVHIPRFTERLGVLGATDPYSRLKIVMLEWRQDLRLVAVLGRDHVEILHDLHILCHAAAVL